MIDCAVCGKSLLMTQTFFYKNTYAFNRIREQHDGAPSFKSITIGWHLTCNHALQEETCKGAKRWDAVSNPHEEALAAFIN